MHITYSRPSKAKILWAARAAENSTPQPHFLPLEAPLLSAVGFLSRSPAGARRAGEMWGWLWCIVELQNGLIRALGFLLSPKASQSFIYVQNCLCSHPEMKNKLPALLVSEAWSRIPCWYCITHPLPRGWSNFLGVSLWFEVGTQNLADGSQLVSCKQLMQWEWFHVPVGPY